MCDFYGLKNRGKIVCVVSRYNEDLGYLLSDPLFRTFDEIIVYNKGDTIEDVCLENICTIINLPNYGREGHTYLYHIIHNYGDLHDVTVFLPGSYYKSEFKKSRADFTISKALETRNTVFLGQKLETTVYEHEKDFTLEYYVSTSDENNQKLTDIDHRIKLASVRPFGEWYRTFIENNNIITCNILCYCGIFAVSRNDIIKNPFDKYKLLYNELDQHPNPETGHFMERSWPGLFYPNNEHRYFLK